MPLNMCKMTLKLYVDDIQAIMTYHVLDQEYQIIA